MKIMHVITTIERGGAEKQLLLLSEFQKSAGHQVEIVFLKGRSELLQSFLNMGVDVDLNICSKNFFKQIILLRQKIRKNDSVIHAHLPRAEILVRLASGKSSYIVTRHNCENFFPGAPSLVSKILSRFVTNKAYKIVAISDAVKEFLIQRREIKSPRKVIIIHYGYEASFSKNKRVINEYRTRERASNEIIFGTISRLSKQKNLEFMINGLSFLRQLNLNFQLKIVGEGELISDLRTLVKQLELEECVKFLGKVEDVEAFLETLDIFILTSHYEGFGMVLLEACDVELPIIAPNNTAIPEVLGINYAGLYKTGDILDFVEKLKETFEIRFRSELSKESQSRKKLFSPKEMEQKLVKVYEQMQIHSPLE